MSNFVHVIAAVEAREKHKGQIDGSDLWSIGDAIIQDCGISSRPEITKSCATELKKRGFPEYSKAYLEQLRDIAMAFPKQRRHRDLHFATHYEARDPDFLDWVIEQRGLDISKRDVRGMRNRWRRVEQQRRDEAHKEARREAQRAATNAATPLERRRAQKMVDDLADMPIPKVKVHGRPDNRTSLELENLADLMWVEQRLEDAARAVDESASRLHKIPQINDAYADGFVEDCEKIVARAQHILAFLRRDRLRVVSGGR